MFRSPGEMMSFLRDRKRAFQLTFRPIKVILVRGLRAAYKATLGPEQPAHLMVLEDMALFCRANESCVVPGDRDKTLMLEGRREVWLRWQQHLQLSPDQLFALYAGRAPQQKDTSV